MEDSATITANSTHHYNKGDRVSLAVRRNGFWIRLWYMLFFGYVPMANKVFVVTQIYSGTTMSLDNVLT